MKFLRFTAMTMIFASMAGCAQADPTSDLSKADIENIVRSYLLENPEIIREAMFALEDKEDRAMLASVNDELFNDPRDVSVGAKDAKVTIVEFFDYNCGYCKRSTSWVESVMKKHPNDVRLVFKEMPILESRTKTSRNASKAALAAGRQNKYSEMHFALMDERSLTSEKIDSIAKGLGLNMKMFKADMNDETIEKHISDTISLAQRIPPLTGTPFFVINDEYIAGADVERLQVMLDDALKG